MNISIVTICIEVMKLRKIALKMKTHKQTNKKNHAHNRMHKFTQKQKRGLANEKLRIKSIAFLNVKRLLYIGVYTHTHTHTHTHTNVNVKSKTSKSFTCMLTSRDFQN